MKITLQDPISQTKNWLNTFIIKHTICPFAKREYDRDSIHYELITSEAIEDQLQALIQSCAALENNSEIETSLLIYPKGLNDFDDYLDFLAIASDLLDKQGYEGIFQLASFHPDYCFDGVDSDDASNYTNRSPYPTLHIIREASLERVLENYPDPESIPQRNIEYTRELGIDVLKKILADCN